MEAQFYISKSFSWSWPVLRFEGNGKATWIEFDGDELPSGLIAEDIAVFVSEGIFKSITKDDLQHMRKAPIHG
jgi:hypothetical protein